MSDRRLSWLLGIILSDPDAAVDAREHWRLHRVLKDLYDWSASSPAHSRAWEASGLPTLTFKPDSAVGIRVVGTTAALWEMVAEGALTIVDVRGSAQLKTDCRNAPEVRRQLMRMDPSVAAAVQCAGQRLAANPTASVNA